MVDGHMAVHGCTGLKPATISVATVESQEELRCLGTVLFRPGAECPGSSVLGVRVTADRVTEDPPASSPL